MTRLETILKELMEKWEGKLIEFNGESDYIHAIIQYSPQTQPSKLINNIKTVSSRYLRKEFSAKLDKIYWKSVFWSGSYFIASCGGVTIEKLEKYLESQNRPK